MRWLRRLVIPVCILAVLIVSSTRVITSHDAGLVHFTWCWIEQLATGEPAADVLVVGSSRSGLGVDPVWIEQELDRTGRTVERLTFGGNSEMDRDLALRTYLRDRGVPEVVVLELGFEQRSRAAQVYFGATLDVFETPTDMPLAFDSRAYAEMVNALVSDGEVALSDVFVSSRVESPAQYLSERFGLGVEVALRHPGSVVEREVRDCEPDIKAPPARWVYGTSRPYQPRRLQPPTEAELDALDASQGIFGEVDFESEYTQDELLLTRDAVRAARDAGVEHVLLLYMPTYGKAGTLVDVEEIRSRFPDEPLIDGQRVMADPSRPLMRYQYVNITHVNRIGARAISQAIADAVDALPRS